MTNCSQRAGTVVGAACLLVGLICAATIQPVRADEPQHVGPSALYPDPNTTPGLADTLKVEDLTAVYTDNCPSHKTECTYSQDHRNVPREEHTQVYDEYNVPQAARNIHDGEVDHFYPLCAGGSNDITNLWYQPAVNMWNGRNFGFHQKDDLETWVCKQIKAGQLVPKEAFDRITTDWVKYYWKSSHRTRTLVNER